MAADVSVVHPALKKSGGAFDHGTTARVARNAGMSEPTASSTAPETAPACADGPPGPALDLPAWYREHFAFVWRTLQRLGVPLASLDDAAQEVFIVVHKRRLDYDGVTPARAWLFGIARRVSARHRRAGSIERGAVFDERQHAARQLDPQQAALQLESDALVQRCLWALDEDKRCVFILAELEDFRGPEIAAALSLNLNTVYARLRAARQQFVAHYRRELARARHADHG
jgi:RNA polymerase sigma-70 factor, ECF subfamily